MILFLLFISAFFTQSLFAQNDTLRNDENKKVIVRGFVKEEKGVGFESVYVYNTRTKSGLLTEPDGSFLIDVLKRDTLKVVSPGYKTKIITVKDSADKAVYFVHLTLQKLVVQLEGVMIETPRDLEDIQEDIDQLGSSSYDYNTKKAGKAITSPISALYQRFSKDAQQQKELARLENEAMNRKVVKDLLNYYNQEGIIDLAKKEYDFFISFCDLNDQFLSYASQYDVAVKIKKCYQNFEQRYQKY
ncbi:MAG: hypothetical protein WD334_11910 [Chitinophagales bacterium]